MTADEPIRPTPDTTDVVGARIAAQLVDVVVLFVQAIAVGVLLVWLVRPDSEAGVYGLAWTSFLLLPLYGGILEAYWNGQTVGKYLVGIKVVEFDGHTPSLWTAFLRNLPAIVIFSWITTVAALAAIATSDRNQRLFDRAAETYVVEVPAAHEFETRS